MKFYEKTTEKKREEKKKMVQRKKKYEGKQNAMREIVRSLILAKHMRDPNKGND